MTQTKKKRRMIDFKIDELSCVDHPAQSLARATIMKRDDRKDDHMDLQKHAPMAFPSFDAAVQHLRKLHGLSGCEAMSKARSRHPDLVEKHQREGEERVAKAADAVAKSRAKPKDVEDFNLVVSGLVEREGISRTAAMSRARKEHPELFRRMQAR